MGVTNKFFITALFLITVTLLFFYFKPIGTSKVNLPNKISNNEIINSYNVGLGELELTDNEKQLLEETIDASVSQVKHADTSNTNNETLVKQFEGSWSLYLDRNSAEYKDLIDKYSNSKEKIFIEGDNVYFKKETDEGNEFTKLTREYINLVQHEPFNVYGMFLKQLDELESYGDWSYDAELVVRKLFSQYFKADEYSINAMQCREKTCLIEFNFSDFNLANNFVDYLRENRKKCQCIPAETIWPELKQAVLKIDLI